MSSTDRLTDALAAVAPAHFRRAMLYEPLGEPAKAVEHYDRFARLWRDRDPELRPMVDSARARLAALGVASRRRG